MSSQTLLIRADANVEIGTGHVMRSLALAQAWQDKGGDVVFAMAAGAPALEARLRQERIPVENIQALPGSGEDAEQTARLAAERRAKWVALDGYHFSGDYQTAVRSAGF